LAELIGNKSTSELLDVHPAVVSKYKNGKNCSNIPDTELVEKIENRLGKINDKIVDKVDYLLDIFAEDRMSDLKASEIPSSIEKLVNTSDKINRRHDPTNGNLRPQVIIYAPKQINVEEYITKEV
jgi:predicted transcriptional regulator